MVDPIPLLPTKKMNDDEESMDTAIEIKEDLDDMESLAEPSQNSNVALMRDVSLSSVTNSYQPLSPETEQFLLLQAVRNMRNNFEFSVNDLASLRCRMFAMIFFIDLSWAFFIYLSEDFNRRFWIMFSLLNNLFMFWNLDKVYDIRRRSREYGKQVDKQILKAERYQRELGKIL